MPATHPPRAALHLEEYTADSNAFYVNSTLIVGPTEVILVDAQYRLADAKRLADQVAATGKHLKAILLSHPDDDHYFGAAAIVERFPGTPVYITPAGLAEFNASAPKYFKGRKDRFPTEVPDSLVTPQLMPSRLTIDGEAIEVIPDLQGDVEKPANSVFWIPSLRAAITGDIAFNGVHVWLASSTTASRTAWHKSLDRVAALHPRIVVAGHKSSADAPDTPDVLTFTGRYLTDFEAARSAAANADALVAAMNAKYPTLAGQGIIKYAAWKSFNPS